MDRVRPAMLIAALVVDVGRWLSRRCGSVVPPSRPLPASKQIVSTNCSPSSDAVTFVRHGIKKVLVENLSIATRILL